MFSFLAKEDQDALAFSIKNAEKDLKYAESVANKVNCAIPLLKQVRLNLGYGSNNLPYLTKI